MTLHLFQRRTIWWPTLSGWLGLLVILGAPLLFWCFQGESFLAQTQRQPPEILVVDGWIGIEGIKAAKIEFEQGHYRHIVATGGLSGNRWDTRRWSFAFEAEEMLLRLGLSREQVILAAPLETANHRTYESAWAVKRALLARGLRPNAINLFTFGVHAKRSRLVYAKVEQPETEVGVISWVPPGYYAGPWWQSSERALDLLKESVGCLLEILLNSGRTSNSSALSVPERG